MLDSLFIKNFRLFKELTIQQLKTVNLIVGKNNSGKTCLLEALQVYASNASPRLLYELIVEREQNWELTLKEEIQPNEEIQPHVEHPFRYLFHGYHFPEIGTEVIEIGSFNATDRLKLRVYPYQLTEEAGEIRRFRVSEQNLADLQLNETELVVEREENAQIKPIMRLDLKDFSERRYLMRRRFIDTAPRWNVQSIATRHLEIKKIAALWDYINLNPSLREEVFNALRLIDDQIQEIVFVNATIPILIYKNSQEKLPLRSLGEGATRLFYIIIALINASNGILLVDEIENGLHYAIQPKIWQLIFTMADQLKVQVFATTHSRDCVKSFYTAWQNYPSLGLLHRLDKYPDDNISVMSYEYQELADVLEVEGEVR